MKFKTVLFLLITVALLVLVGCSDDDKKSSVVGSDLTDNANYIIAFAVEEHFVSIQSKVEVESCTLTMNNEEIALRDWSHYEDTQDPDAFPWSTLAISLPTNIDYTPGSDLNFALNINGHEYNTVLAVQSVPEVTFPELDFDQDYIVSWESETSPTRQSVDFDLEFYSLIDMNDYVEVYEESDELAGSIRSYTFPKSLYSQYADWGMGYFDVSFDASNYIVDGDLVAMSFVNKTNDTEDKTISKSLRYKKMIKSILANQ